MSDINLKASLEVDASGVKKGSQESVSSLQAIQAEIIKTQDAIKTAADPASVDRLGVKLNNLQRNLATLGGQGGASGLATPLNNATQAAEGLSTQMTNVGQGATNLSRIMNRNMHGVADLFIAPGRAALIFANDLPILIEKFKEAKAAQEALRAEGKAAASNTQLLSQAFNPLGAAVSLGAIALIHLVPKMADYVSEANKAVNATTILSDALSKSSDYGTAIANVSKLTEDIKLAKDGFLDKTKVVDEYNKTIGKTTGLVKSVDDAEQQLIKNKDAYLQMLAEKAVAAEAYSQMSKKIVEAALEEAQPVSKSSFGSSVWAVITGGLTDPQAYESNLEDAKAQSVRAKKDFGKMLQDIASSAESKAAAIAKDWGFNLFGDNGDGTGRGVKAAKKVVSAMTELNDAFAKIDRDASNHIIHFSDVTKQQFAAVQKAIERIVAEGGNLNGLKDLQQYLSTALTEKGIVTIKAPDVKLESPKVDSNIKTGLQKQFDGIAQAKEDASKKLASTLESQNEALNATIVSSMTTFAEGVGQAFGSGDFSNLGAEFMESLGSAIEQFGAQMLAYAVQANVLTQTLLDFFATPVGIAAATSLVAIGAAIKALAKGGTGATKSQSSSYSSGYTSNFGGGVSSPSNGAIASPAYSGAAKSVPVGSIANVLASSMTQVAQGSRDLLELKVNGSDLITVIERARKKQNA